jgi:twinkle protein
MSDGQLIEKRSCDICGSSDGRAYYDDAHSYCFVCDPKDAWRAEEGYEGGDREGSAPLSSDLLRGEIVPLGKRKLDQKVLERYGYRVGEFKGKKVQIAPYHDASGRIVAQKLRTPDKDMIWLGTPKDALPLYGQKFARMGGRMIVVTEGELDAMSVTQAMGLDFPAVSIQNGAPNAAKTFGQAIEFLESFDKVVIMFDMDDVGRKAAVAAAAVLRPGKAFIAELPLKDASDMVVAGRSGEIVKAAWGAQPYRPDGIVTVDDVMEKALSPPKYGRPWPWPSMTQATYGIRPELYTLGAGVGSGKTTAFKQVMLTTMFPEMAVLPPDIEPLLPHDWREPRKVGAIFLEEGAEKTLRALAGMRIGTRSHIPGVDFDEPALRAAMTEMRPYWHAYSHFGAKDWGGLKGVILYMVLGLGITDVFLDNLTALIAFAEDDRKALDGIMADLASMVEQHHFTLHLISHLTTPEGKAHEEGGRVLEKQFTGGRSIARWSHNMWALERDKQKADSPSTARILKDRETGDATGKTFGLGYNKDTGLYEEVSLDEDNGGFKDERTANDF